VDEPIDPIEQMMQRHLARMQEIADTGYTAAKESATSVVERIKKNVGLRDAIKEQALTALNINNDT
jgi:hypothetical protein